MLEPDGGGCGFNTTRIKSHGVDVVGDDAQSEGGARRQWRGEERDVT